MPIMSKESGIATLITFMAEEHIFTYLLSSPFTARNIVVERGDVENVKQDLNLSIILSVALSIVAGMLVQDVKVSIAGMFFGILLYLVYAWRSELWT